MAGLREVYSWCRDDYSRASFGLDIVKKKRGIDYPDDPNSRRVTECFLSGVYDSEGVNYPFFRRLLFSPSIGTSSEDLQKEASEHLSKLFEAKKKSGELRSKRGQSILISISNLWLQEDYEDSDLSLEMNELGEKFLALVKDEVKLTMRTRMILMEKVDSLRQFMLKG